LALDSGTDLRRLVRLRRVCCSPQHSPDARPWRSLMYNPVEGVRGDSNGTLHINCPAGFYQCTLPAADGQPGYHVRWDRDINEN
jgi:hypothetical protein